MKLRAACLALLLLGPLAACAVDVGVARIDVTPDEPIRLTGYGNRRTNSIGVEQKLWAKALALGSDREGPALLLTLDNCGVTEAFYKELVSRLIKRTKLKPGGIAVACSHTHSAPATIGWAPNIFSSDILPEQQAAIDRYTRGLLDKLEQVALAALKDRKPAQLAWAQGEVGFARNRRVVVGKTANFGENATGPVDHALPVLRVTGVDGKLRALVANYACHCTTLGGEFNHVCGDWAGYAQEAIERDHPGATALITIGCGADANPSPRGTLALARQHGDELAAEVKRLLGLTFTPLLSPSPLNGERAGVRGEAIKITTGYKELRLPFGPHFTRAEWQARATNSGIVGYHAKKWLARLDRGEKPPDSLYYPINTWRFGDDLAMVFLPGEVVVDYVLRLKREFDPARLWVSSYANYVPCYIPSRRILADGGYEAEGSLWYYDRPARISTNAEELIIKTVHELMPKSFRVDQKKAEFPDPLTPKQALGTMRTKANFTVELVASEPLIESPVAIDWDARGRLWVCEMFDYPTGLKPPPEQDRKWGEPIKAPPGGFTPGGRIKILTSTKGDGHYDKATLFLDKLSFPTGVFPWRNRALICAAPDILYAEDTDGDGRADVVRTNFTGFATHNYQARVNGFRWGLDGWLHGSSGLFGGKIKSLLTGKEVDLGGRDFRIKPDTGEIEPLAGISQFGRVRDDFDNWFGNDNSTLLWHYPLAEHYMRRNPHVTYPDPRVNVAAAGARAVSGRVSEPVSGKDGASAAPSHSPAHRLTHSPDPNRIFPLSRTLDRFNHPESANRVTSACGIDIYRDNLLGAEYYGNAFICEPVHNLVTRLVLEPDGVTFAGRRADDEQRGEFLASTDNWFRPVQVRTGPDGALWVVDMYRFVIEHPRWIAPDRLKTLDVRAGADKGRIYRVYPKGAKLRPVQDLTKLEGDQLARALDSRNGTARDLAHIQLVQRKSSPPVSLSALATNQAKAAIRVQALAALDGLHILDTNVLVPALGDADVRVAAQALRCAEPLLREITDVFPMTHPTLAGPLRALHFTKDKRLAFQQACSLGECASFHWATPGIALAFSFAGDDDKYLRAAALSGAARQAGALLGAHLPSRKWRPWESEVVAQLVRTAVGEDDRGGVALAFAMIGAAGEDHSFEEAARQARVLAALLEALGRRNETWGEFLDASRPLRRATGAKTVGTTEEGITAAKARITGILNRAFANLAASDRPWDSTNRLQREYMLASVELLGHETGRMRQHAATFCRLLRAGPTPEFRTALLAALGRMREPWVPREILSHWSGFTPSVRAELLALLITRESWTEELIEAVVNRDIAPGELSMLQRQALLRHKDQSIRERASAVFATGTSTRREVLARYERLDHVSAQADRGAPLFDKHCAQCHAWRGRGHAVGPNLAEFAGKGVADFVLAILDPNTAINPNFLAYNVETKDGRSLTGIVRGETASGLTLVQGGGVEEKILRGDIAEIRASALSLMPEGLEQALSPQDMADLIAWLKQGAPMPFGHASANADVAARNRADFLKSGASGIAKVVTAAETLPYRSWIGTLPLTYCRQSTGVNRLAWEAERRAPARRDPTTTQRAEQELGAPGTVSFRFPAAMGFLTQPQGKFTLHLNRKPVLDFDVSLADAVWSSADGRVRMSYTVREANTEDSSGSLLIEVDSSLVMEGKPARFEVTGSESGSQRWFGVYRIEL